MRRALDELCVYNVHWDEEGFVDRISFVEFPFDEEAAAPTPRMISADIERYREEWHGDYTDEWLREVCGAGIKYKKIDAGTVLQILFQRCNDTFIE